MVRSVQASLDYYTRQFGPYPHGQVRLVEHPGDAVLLHASPDQHLVRGRVLAVEPGQRSARTIDFPFAVVAHEVAHQWWGNPLTPAPVEGAALLTESLAWYSALGVVEETFGREHLRRLLGMMREAYLIPRARASVPLLRADDWFLAYRKGPFAMYALREYVGAEPVNGALRRLLERHGAGKPPLPTSLDLYRELQAVTPDVAPLSAGRSVRGEHVLGAGDASASAAEQTSTGEWQVTLDVQARKVVVDAAGVETDVPMDDLVEVGVFAGAQDGGSASRCTCSMHRIRSGGQRITVTVPSQPARAGIDPRNLLIDVEGDDNLKEISARRESFVAHAVISLVLVLLIAVAAAGGLVPAVRAAQTPAIVALRPRSVPHGP